jgi:tryptophan halogenase
MEEEGVQLMDLRDIKDVTILGGGTAGWLVALYAKTVLPTKKVTLIESDKIGILGAGEGSTPQLISFLDVLQIPISKLIQEADVTIKNGIKFTNWNNGGKSDWFYHPFVGYGNCAASNVSLERYVSGTPTIFAEAAKLKESQDEWCFITRLCEQNKVSFKTIQNQMYSAEDPVLQFEKMGSFSLHFDARKLAKTLSEIGQDRGIIHVEGVVEDYTTDDEGYVTTLKLENGESIKTDFIFDCSGFKSFFSKKFNTKWISAKQHLTVNAAMPFFIDMDSEIPPYTEAVAMKYGWMWMIPLQSRYGCGYVFNSDMIDDEQAKEEIIEFLGYDPEWPREKSFSWEPGYLEEPWKKNVYTAGLSAGFVEPLEATSIWTTIIDWTSAILGNTELMYIKDQGVIDDFNASWRKNQEEVIGFIYAHYMSGRTDTEFWKHYTYENAPAKAKQYLDINNKRAFIVNDFIDHAFFEIDSWSYILLGIKNQKFIDNHKLFEFYNFTRTFMEQRYISFKKLIQTVADFEAVSHKEFLERMKEQ